MKGKPRWLRSCSGSHHIKRICQPNYGRRRFPPARRRVRIERRQLPKRRLRIMSMKFRGERLLNTVSRNKKRMPIK